VQLRGVTGEALDFRSIHGRSAEVAHVAATAGRIYKTADGGQTWRLTWRASDTTTFLDAIDFWDDRHGIVLGDPLGGRFLILLTDDGGESWHEAPPSSRPEAMSGEAAFAASGSSLVIDGMRGAWIGSGGKVARLFRTTDRGVSWTAIPAPLRQGGASEGIFSVAAAGKRMLVVGGDYQQNDSTRANAAIYVPGQKEWLSPSAPPGGYRSGVAAARGGAVAMAVGPGGSDISVDGGTTWRPFDATGFHAVRSSGSGVFFASGSDGRMAYHSARRVP
jgi:photosystem II stability/assembly factor-like uncharacterized protein